MSNTIASFAAGKRRFRESRHIQRLMPANVRSLSNLMVAAILLMAASGCANMYYDAMEKVGVHKRDILGDRIADARDSQHDAKQQFSSALERFQSELNFDGGDLQSTYQSLNREFERSQARAEVVRERIDAVDDVATALFVEWRQEIDQYSSAKLRRLSNQQLKHTQRRYHDLLRAMRHAEQRMQPVLRTLQDQVLFLKHNLNARAVASIRGEFGAVANDVAELIRDMEASIAKADAFIEELAVA